MYVRLVAALALFSTVSLIAAACGGDDDDYGGSTTNSPATSPAAGATTSGSGGQTNAAVVKVGNNVKFGSILTAADGMTLYTFTQDAPGKSNCNGSCAATWPPVTTSAASAPTVEGAPGKFSLVTRDDGTKQVAYNGSPLYRYTPDKAPGDTNGQGVGNVWFVATASAAVTPAASGTTPVAGADGSYGAY
jgi:predicted lipoprotein with Yx(FWY)xxD motif